MKSIEAVDYENTRNDFKCCDYWKSEKQYVRLQLSIPGSQGAFLDKINFGTDGFTDEPVFYQCDVQVIKSSFVDDSK